MKHKNRTGSLRTKLLLSIVIMIAAILAVAGIVIVTSVSGSVTEINNLLTAQIVNARADEISRYVSGLISETTMWAERNVIMSGDFAIVGPDLVKRQAGLRSDFEMTFYSDLTGAAVTSLDTQINIADRQYFADIMSGAKDYAVSNPVISKATGETVFIVAHVVKNAEGDTIGLFGASVLLDTFNAIVSEIDLGGSARAWLIDNTGLMVVHPNEEIRMSMSVQNSAERGFDGLDAVGQKMLAGEIGNGQYLDSSGERTYAYFAPISAVSGWSMAISAAEADVLAPVNSLLLKIIIIVLIGLLLGAAATFVLSSSIVKPVKAAANLATALASGDFTQTVQVRTNDEVGQLTKILDEEVRSAFKNIEAARVVTDKQTKFQKAEVDKLLINLQRLARGELLCDIVVADADADTAELHTLFSEISANLHGGLSAIKGYISEISGVLGEMSEGNLAIGITAEYLGDFVALKESINMIINSLNTVMGDINTAADQVASGTRQVSDGSQEISQGATEQASSIEELTASILQIAEQTRQNAMSANKANELTTAAASVASHGNERMNAMQDAMAQINDGSRNISKIIKVIDDIAFQTNILALNAAVEAARAGMHGKGFAVVAEEVRNLAARSASAAKETTELIEGSIGKAEAGTKIADETAQALLSIVERVDKAAQLVGEIAGASNEQASAIAQVNRGIEQLSQVVQTNSATSEEAAAASEELSSQAELLKNMVAQFTLKNTAAGQRFEHSAAAGQKKLSAHATPAMRPSNDDFGKY